MRQQMNMRELHGEGIASITTNLNMVMQAFNMAALTEAGNNAWQAIADLHHVTDDVRNRQVIATAISTDETNQRIIDRFSSLSGASEALQTAIKIRSTSIANTKVLLKDLEDRTSELRHHVQTSIGLDAAADVTTTEPSRPAKNDDDDLLLKI